MPNPTICGQEYQHATVDFQIGGATAAVTFSLSTFSKFNYKVGAKKKPVHNSQGDIIGYTIDVKETEGSLAMLSSEWKAIKEQLAQQYPTLGIGQIEMEAVVTYGNNVNALMTDVVQFMFNEESRTSEGNQEAHVSELPLFVRDAQLHGGDFITYRR
jgi:hypothetical protein